MAAPSKKRLVILVYFKITPQRNNRVKVSALFRAGHKVSEVDLVGVSRTNVYEIKKRRMMAKVSADLQAEVERLLWIVTACGI